jgi:hypothetical protein
VFCWTDRWHGMTMDDIRQFEEQIKKELDEVQSNDCVRCGVCLLSFCLLLYLLIFYACSKGRTALCKGQWRSE